MAVVSGKAAFAHLDSTEVYNGQDTGKYTLTITLDDDNADLLAEQGVKFLDYVGTIASVLLCLLLCKISLVSFLLVLV